MLIIVDQGCTRHRGRQLTVDAAVAGFMQNLLYNLQRQGEFHTFICEHGHTHCVSMQNQALKAA